MDNNKFRKKSNFKESIQVSEYGKLPPAAIDLEEAILGACITNFDCCNLSLKILSNDCFYKEAHQIIFQTIEDMAEKEIPIEMITVVHHLRTTGKIDEIGGPYVIALIVNKLTSTVNCEFHCYVVFEMFVKRELIRLFSEETSNLFSDNCDIFMVYERVQYRLEEIFEKLSDIQVKHMKTSIERTLHEIESYNDGTDVSFLKTGIRLFDEHVFLSPKMIIGIAASRGAGKTRYLIYLMKKIFSINDNVAALWYSFEDSDTKIIRAFAATNTGLSDAQMQSKAYKLSTEQLSCLKTEINKFSKYDIDFINEQESISSISRTFHRFIKKRPEKICFLLIDNIMLIDDLHSNTNGNTLAIEDKIAASLRKIINKSEKIGHKVIIVFLHHMTKDMENKYNLEEAYRPRLVHLKGSSRFADVANAIILINKPGMHKDLIKKHSALPDINCINSDNSTRIVKREVLLQNMLIIEAAKNRDGDIEDNVAIQRYVADLALMKFTELNCLK